MRLAILSRTGTNEANRRLVAAATAAGHEPVVLDPFLFLPAVGDPAGGLTHDGAPIEIPEGMIPRIGAGTNASGVAVVRYLEGIGVVSLNGSDALERCRDKFRALQHLARRGLPVPSTKMTLREEDVIPAVRAVGGPPVVLKLLEAGQGTGVFLARDEGEALEIIRRHHAEGRYIIIQQFVAESRGSDLRALVVGGSVVAAMRRKSSGAGEFRSNVHLGGTATAVELPAPVAELAVRATVEIGLGAAGVDLIEAGEGPLVIEVNASPGLEGIETATGVDVAGAMVARLEALVAADRA